jgi:tetratricopeptide (TPR) repeat protein
MVLYANRRDFAAAEPLLREAVAMNQKLLGEEDPEVATTINNLALLLRDKGEYKEAEALSRRSLAMKLKIFGENNPNVGVSFNNLARVLQFEHDYPAAESEYRHAIEAYRNAFPANHWEIATIESLLGSCLTEERRFQDAEPLLLKSYPIIKANFGDSHNRTRVALRRIVDLYTAWGQPQKAAPYVAMMPK